jgi:superfamily I DNA and/or RNA helicase
VPRSRRSHSLRRCRDHQQLRPAVARYDLARVHKLDISMFERLINSGMRHVTLQTQRRMHPDISSLIRPAVYAMLQDAESTREHSPVRGLLHRVYFMTHTVPEDGKRSAFGSTDVIGGSGVSHLRVGELGNVSKSNAHEANLAIGLVVHLLLNGYTANQLVVLSMYNGQVSIFVTHCGAPS